MTIGSNATKRARQNLLSAFRAAASHSKLNPTIMTMMIGIETVAEGEYIKQRIQSTDIA